VDQLIGVSWDAWLAGAGQAGMMFEVMAEIFIKETKHEWKQ
jgi:hypothetical protein